VGHGIGSEMHQPPDVLNYRTSQRAMKLRPGLCLAVEPMITRGGITSHTLADEWTVVTADALHTQRATARYLTEQCGADYILTVKRNQPSLFDQVKRLPWAQAPTGDTDRHRAHGRAETRTVKALSIEGLGFPYAAQAVRIRRHVTDLRTGKVSWTCAYAVTSLGAEQAGAARLGALVRGHWAIEVLHHVRDTTFAEDACKVRSGHGPANLATLRSLAALLLSALGRPTIPDAIRWVSYACFTRPLDLIGLA